MCDKDRGLVAAPGTGRRHDLGGAAAWLLASTLLALSATACGSKPPEIVAGKMPEGGNFSGVYFSPQYGEMNMVQNGSAVIGEYKQEMRTGKIQGEASGDLMKFEWIERKALVSNRAQETRGHGYFRYVVDPANGDHILKGEWGLGDAQLGGGPWNAYKAKGKEPKLSQETSGGDSSGSEGGDSSGESNEESDELF
ncbi:MAG TPA: hypothetical protein VFN67_07760 [Polyangiales bacterium]|nr:hypothetical protein [Polyangiales bacterium]